ncbi:MAG: 2,3-diphosphoglycerate-dependent phosphoglycerate mutase [Pseudomonadota bacterium]
MTKLALLRHGQSEWNLANRFTGWVDVALTDEGVEQARKSGALMREANLEFAGAYTSVLTRAVKTLNLALEEMGRLWLPVEKSWRLNERHYGGLTGLNKQETAEKHGADQVKIWRRSYDTPPPAMDEGNPHDISADPRYAGLNATDVPRTESLKLTLDRVTPYWEETLAPRLLAGDGLIIAAHGNSLRALVKLLFRVPDEEIVNVEIPTGNPLIIELREGSLTPTSAMYLDDARATNLPKLPE